VHIGASVTLTTIMDSFKQLIATQPAYKVSSSLVPDLIDSDSDLIDVFWWRTTASRPARQQLAIWLVGQPLQQGCVVLILHDGCLSAFLPAATITHAAALLPSLPAPDVYPACGGRAATVVCGPSDSQRLRHRWQHLHRLAHLRCAAVLAFLAGSGMREPCSFHMLTAYGLR
jgi:hypothetical protein